MLKLHKYKACYFKHFGGGGTKIRAYVTVFSLTRSLLSAVLPRTPRSLLLSPALGEVSL